MKSEARAAKAALAARQLGERQALRLSRRGVEAPLAIDVDRNSLRALIDNDFADRFARILKDTPADQRAAALARLQELKAASLAILMPSRPAAPFCHQGHASALQLLKIKHRAERAALASRIKAEGRPPSPHFVRAGLLVTARLPVPPVAAGVAAGVTKRRILAANTRHFGT